MGKMARRSLSSFSKFIGANAARLGPASRDPIRESELGYAISAAKRAVKNGLAPISSRCYFERCTSIVEN